MDKNIVLFLSPKETWWLYHLLGWLPYGQAWEIKRRLGQLLVIKPPPASPRPTNECE